MDLRALLLSQDQELIAVLDRALADLGIGVEVYSSAAWAREDVREHKFDAILVDFDVDGAAAVLAETQKSTCNGRSLTFAIVSADTGVPDAMQQGAKLALQKPISIDRARSSLRALYGLVVQERRRFFRYALDIPVEVSPDDRTIVYATSINVSEGGIALRCDQPFSLNTMLKLSFLLPGTKVKVETKGVVQWSDPMGRIGVRFESTSKASASLREWLETQNAVF